MITKKLIDTILTSPELAVTTRHPYVGMVAVGDQAFDRADRAGIEWQYYKDSMGGFKRALWTAIEAADCSNLDRIALGFPDEVRGFKAWTRGNLAERLRMAGAEFERGEKS